ncbi:MAG: dTDP-4-dehydrorhamnose 3,5-epimerase [Ruminiclostridium sp.]|nr:dTDP-4-dehydrorhamnose 3,5-epimerase [Ruminiclostridium sp.]
MSAFKIIGTSLKDAFVIEAFHVKDNRGAFVKYFEKDAFIDLGIEFSLNESFISVSDKNVIRGMHFQLNSPQAKLVSVPKGVIYDVIIDLRKNSGTYGKWTGVELSSDNNCSLYVPRGFAHGFRSLENDTVVLYQCDGKYDKESDTGIRFDDPDIGIEWNIDIADVICSEKDRNLMSFRSFREKTFLEINGGIGNGRSKAEL